MSLAPPEQQIKSFHPLASTFDMMEGDEYYALVADIKKNGLLYRIVTFEGQVLDGRNRQRACLEAGVEPEYIEFAEGAGTHAEALAYVVSVNVHRRHLTTEDKKKVAAKLLAMNPEKSDRQIGKEAGISKNTASAVREAEEGRGHVDQVATRTDTKGRSQPARKATKRTSPAEAEDPSVLATREAAAKRIRELLGRPEGEAAPTSHSTGPSPTPLSPAEAIHQQQLKNVEANADSGEPEPDQPKAPLSVSPREAAAALLSLLKVAGYFDELGGNADYIAEMISVEPNLAAGDDLCFRLCDLVMFLKDFGRLIARDKSLQQAKTPDPPRRMSIEELEAIDTEIETQH
jgi:hypothetical protein